MLPPWSSGGFVRKEALTSWPQLKWVVVISCSLIVKRVHQVQRGSVLTELVVATLEVFSYLEKNLVNQHLCSL